MIQKKNLKMDRLKLFTKASISGLNRNVEFHPKELRLNDDVIAKVIKDDPIYALRLAQCWNILRTCTDEQLIAMERQVDKILEETSETGLVVGVNIGPELPF